MEGHAGRARGVVPVKRRAKVGPSKGIRPDTQVPPVGFHSVKVLQNPKIPSDSRWGLGDTRYAGGEFPHSGFCTPLEISAPLQKHGKGDGVAKQEKIGNLELPFSSGSSDFPIPQFYVVLIQEVRQYKTCHFSRIEGAGLSYPSSGEPRQVPPRGSDLTRRSLQCPWSGFIRLTCSYKSPCCSLVEGFHV